MAKSFALISDDAGACLAQDYLLPVQFVGGESAVIFSPALSSCQQRLYR